MLFLCIELLLCGVSEPTCGRGCSVLEARALSMLLLRRKVLRCGVSISTSAEEVFEGPGPQEAGFDSGTGAILAPLSNRLFLPCTLSAPPVSNANGGYLLAADFLTFVHVELCLVVVDCEWHLLVLLGTTSGTRIWSNWGDTCVRH